MIEYNFLYMKNWPFGGDLILIIGSLPLLETALSEGWFHSGLSSNECKWNIWTETDKLGGQYISTSLS